MSERVCAFCRRTQDEVRHLVSGEYAAICDACVMEALTALIVSGAVAVPLSRPPSAFYRRRPGPIV